MQRFLTIDSAILIFYMTAIIALGFRAIRHRKKGAEDYILAGRTLTLPMFVATLVPSFYGGVLGVGEYAYKYGLCTWLIQGFPYYLFAALYVLFFAGKIRVSPGMTIPDHLEAAFDRRTALMGALLVFIVTTPASEILMLGMLLHWASGWPLWISVLLIMGLALSYLFTGGFRSDVWTNCLEFLFMFGGFALIIPFAYMAKGGITYLHDHVPALHMTWTGGHSPFYIFTWFFIALWTLVDPGFHQRVCAAQDVKTAKKGILVSIFFWFLFDCMTTTAGLYARAILPNLESPMLAYPVLAREILPPLWQGLFFAGMVSSIIASLDAEVFIASITLAKDGLGRIFSIKGKEEKWIRWGLVVTGAFSVTLALLIPSVVDLWWTIGSTAIPGLLVPMASAYIPALRVDATTAFFSSLLGFVFAMGALLTGVQQPFYPGLAASLSVWTLGKLGAAGRRRAH